LSRAARPIGYTAKLDIETTWAARTMRWGGVLLVAFIIFHQRAGLAKELIEGIASSFNPREEAEVVHIGDPDLLTPIEQGQ
jgi:hypothetical protein